MSTWNYRVAKNDYDEYVIVEVYYDEEGKVTNWSGAISALGDDRASLQADLQTMLMAFDKPVFEEVIG